MKPFIILSVLLATVIAVPAQVAYQITKVDGLTVDYELVLDKVAYAAKKVAVTNAQSALASAVAAQTQKVSAVEVAQAALAAAQAAKTQADAAVVTAQTTVSTAQSALRPDLGSSVSLNQKDLDAITTGPGTEAEKKAALMALVKGKIDEGIKPFLQSKMTGSVLSPVVGASIDVR